MMKVVSSCFILEFRRNYFSIFLQNSQMSKTIDFFCLSMACIELSSIMKARNQMPTLIEVYVLCVLWLKYAVSSATGSKHQYKGVAYNHS